MVGNLGRSHGKRKLSNPAEAAAEAVAVVAVVAAVEVTAVAAAAVVVVVGLGSRTTGSSCNKSTETVDKLKPRRQMKLAERMESVAIHCRRPHPSVEPIANTAGIDPGTQGTV